MSTGTHHEKTCLWIFRPDPAKTCTITDDWILDISDLGKRGVVQLCSKNKGADQLHDDCTADPHLCFCICKKQVFSCRGSYKVDCCCVFFSGAGCSKYC